MEMERFSQKDYTSQLPLRTMEVVSGPIRDPIPSSPRHLAICMHMLVTKVLINMVQLKVGPCLSFFLHSAFGIGQRPVVCSCLSSLMPSACIYRAGADTGRGNCRDIS